MKTLRIFISSPSDVRAERVRAYDVVQRLQAKFRAFIKVEAILWEDEPMRATASFQAQIPKPSESDVVICVLWAKIGTRLPQDYKRPDGSVPTGTEWEFEDAYEAFKTRGTPDLLVYRKTAPPHITITSDEMLEEWQKQKKALDAFLNRWFRDHEGAFKAAFQAFNSDEDFEKLLTEHLDKIINEKLETKVPISWTEGSPFRGLDVFHLEHQKIFFGRDLAIAEITQRLIEQSHRGRVFLIVLGMSGCGKSSLVRAGVLPEIICPGVVKNVDCWRWAVLRPSEASGDLTEALASALFGEKHALPELIQHGYNAERLAALLREAPTHAIPFIEAALKNAAQRFADDKLRTTLPEARLILFIDQLEEIFTIERFDAAQRAAFIGAISALSRSGLVWVITTMRSDLYAYCSEIEELRTLKAEDGQFDLNPPGVSEIGQIVRMPALAAGLEFESHPVTHQKLDDTLQEEASENPEALPLLEFCLDELYKLRTDAHVITWEAYEKLGGLKGAITKRAEEVYGGLSEAGKRAFPNVLAALVTMDAAATSRPARRKELVNNPGTEEVVAAFTRANLFLADVDQSGEPVVAVAHEAFINSWPRVQEWVQENKDFLRFKTRIAQAAHRWRESEKDEDFLLPAGKPLAEAEDALEKRRSELEDTEFIQASVKRAVERRKSRRLRSAGILTLVLSLIFGSVIVYQIGKRRDALAAESSARIAASDTDFTLAAEEMAVHETPASLAYLADALRKNPANEKATALTIEELSDSTLPLVTVHHDDEVQDAAFSPDGTEIVTASADGTARLWDVKTGNEIGAPMKHGGWVHTAEFSPDGNEIVTASWDGTARIWDARTGAQIGKAMESNGKVGAAHFSRDGKMIATASWDYTARVWDAQTGDQLGEPMQHKDIVWSVAFNPTGTLVVTASADKTARVWNVPIQKKEIGTIQHKAEVNVAAFSPDGDWFVTASDDGTSRLWNARTLQQVGSTMSHNGSVNYVSFSPNGQRVVTASSDGTARIWEVPSGKEIGEPMRHAGWVRAATFSPNNLWVVTSSYDRTARVWDASTGLPVSEPMRHSGAVYMARFSPDSSLIVTASFDHTARIWKWQKTQNLPAMRGPGQLMSACLASDGGHIATVSDKNIQIWEAGTGQTVGPPINLEGAVKAAACSSDGKYLVTVSLSGAQIWDASTGARVGQPILPAETLLAARFDPQERWVMTVAADGVSLWDAKTGQQVGQPIRPAGKVANAAFNSDGGMIATYSEDGTVNVWNAQTGGAIGKPMQNQGRVTSVNFSVDGALLAAASSTGHAAHVWNVQTGKAVSTMHLDTWVNDAEFSPDGKWIVTACGNSTAQVWDVQTGQPVSQMMRHKDAVNTASFSPDGRWVVTASADGTAQVWDARTGVAVSEPMSHLSKAMPDKSQFVNASFSQNGKWIVTGEQSADEKAPMWEVRIGTAPITTNEAPAWLIELAEYVGGERLDANGVLQTSPPEEDAAQLRARLSQLADTDAVSQFGRWFAADPVTRTLSSRGN